MLFEKADLKIYWNGYELTVWHFDIDVVSLAWRATPPALTKVLTASLPLTLLIGVCFAFPCLFLWRQFSLQLDAQIRRPTCSKISKLSLLDPEQTILFFDLDFCIKESCRRPDVCPGMKRDLPHGVAPARHRQIGDELIGQMNVDR